MTGDFFGGSSPSTTCKSVRQTPHTSTRTSNCPAAGSGLGTSPYSRGFFSTSAGARRKQAFIAALDQDSSAHPKGGQHTCYAQDTQKSRRKKGSRDSLPVWFWERLALV